MSIKYFVPLSGTVIRRYQKQHDLPPHDVMDRSLLHGQIQLTLTAKTPIMVSNGKQIHEGRSWISCFATDANGKYYVPGSSLRGLIRQNMQILGCGTVCVGRNEDIPEKYRSKRDNKFINTVSGNRDPKDGLPPSHKHPVLDYPRSIMGFVMQETQPASYNTQKRKTVCYRSRVSVGDLAAVGNPQAQPTVLIQPQLPRQSDPSFVTELGGGRFRLNGIRQYPPRPIGPEPYRSYQGFRPLPAGTKFTGTIRYRNLHPDELGLLLWCLRLEEGCLHTMGMGKANGYGQVTLEIDRLREFDPSQLYSSLTASGTICANLDDRVTDLIGIYQDYAAKNISSGKNPAQMDHIRTFLELRRKR